MQHLANLVRSQPAQKPHLDDLRLSRIERSNVLTSLSADGAVRREAFPMGSSSSDPFGQDFTPCMGREADGMKHTSARIGFAILFTTLLVLGTPPKAQAGEQRECSDGAELRAISVTVGNVETRVYKKQFSRGRKEE